jgi:uncharacterized protein (TIGR04255 family)
MLGAPCQRVTVCATAQNFCTLLMSFKDMTPLKSPPIVEAVFGIETEHAPEFQIESVFASLDRSAFNSYPELREGRKNNRSFTDDGKMSTLVDNRVEAYQLYSDDKKQVLQFRESGISLNRLAPYGSFDEYIEELRLRWNQFVGFAKPLKVKTLELRYINRILIPIEDGRAGFQDYIKIAPKLSISKPTDNSAISFRGLRCELFGEEKETNNQIVLGLATEQIARESLPFVFDLRATNQTGFSPDDWPKMADAFQQLRRLKNNWFLNSLSEKCLTMFL